MGKTKSKIVRVELPLYQMSAQDKQDLASSIGKIASGSPEYAASPALQQSVAKLVQDGLDIGTKAQAVALKRSELAAAEADLAASQIVFDRDAGVCVKTAESICITAEQLAGLGLKARDAKSPPVALVVPTNIIAKPGKDKGSIYSHAKMIPGIPQYPAQISVDPIGTDTWKTLQGTSAVRRISGLVSGARYWIRIATQRGDQQSAWSDPIAVIAR